jgi:RNA polymerase sigma factor (sigma-70 family)
VTADEPNLSGARTLCVAASLVTRRGRSGLARSPERDRELLRRITDGDQRALEELYDRYAGACHALALRVVVDAALAQDVVQDVFLAAWTNAGRYDSERAEVSTYLLSMTHHKAVDVVRREESQRRRQTVVEDAAVDASDPELEVWSVLERERIRAALDKLPVGQRQALELAYYGGYTQREIAGLMEVPLGTVKTRMLAGMRKLAGLLGNAAAVDLGEGRP